MEKYDKILHDEVYITHIRRCEECEKDREFGHHDMAHFLDVARVGMIINLTENYGISKELIYGAALLHDVGRDVQYLEGIPHDVASVEIAKDILSRTEYTFEEQNAILEAIGNHRKADIRQEKSLSGLIYRADKESRPCYFCKAFEECNWKSDKKNTELVW